jgi:hypothetical protein
MSRTMTKGIDYTSKDYEAFKQLLIEKLQEKMPEYTDTSETDAGIVILEALANGLDILSLYMDIIANDVLLPTTQDRSIAIIIAECLGYTPYNQTASEYEQVFVIGEVRELDTLIPQGTIVRTKENSDLATLYFETMEDLVIPAGKLGNEKDDEGNYLYHVTIKAGETVQEDVIGTSTGAPLQSFACNYANVLIDSLEVYVEEGNGEELWTRVSNFIESDGTSKVYTVSIDDFDVCTIQFGNGIKGKIPKSYVNGISANYRIGGGEATNVNAGVINILDTGIAYVEETFNLECSVLAHDKEDLDSIKQNAPAMFRSKDRLVTLDDYEDLLRMNFYSFLALHATNDSLDKKLVHLFYMLREGYSMTTDLAEEIAEYIQEKGMIGTTYDIAEYTPQAVDITATLYVDPDYDGEEIKSNVIAYLEGVTFKYGNLLFEDTIIKSDIENEIKETFEGVLTFRITSPTEDIISPKNSYNVLTLGNTNITIKYL